MKKTTLRNKILTALEGPEGSAPRSLTAYDVREALGILDCPGTSNDCADLLEALAEKSLLDVDYRETFNKGGAAMAKVSGPHYRWKRHIRADHYSIPSAS